MTTLLQKFEDFHENNPNVFEYYKRFAQESVNAGNTKLSIALITERIRWELDVVTRSDDGFKINNNQRAFYARKLNEIPMFEGMFSLRSQAI